MQSVPDTDLFVVAEVTSKDELERYFRKDNILLHLYEIGDLDDFFWSHTKWTALKNAAGEVQFILLLYSATSLPVVLAMGTQLQYGDMLLRKMEAQGLLPSAFYSHLSVGLPEAICEHFESDHHGRYLKMGLMDKTQVKSVDVSDTVRLLPADLADIKTFYAHSYPGNWFDDRMLESMQTFGIWSDVSADAGQGTELIAVAGIHVFSNHYSVASLGNIAVHPAHRGKGLARKVTAALLVSLLDASIEHVGLNVRADNGAAIACYRRLGFKKVGEYEEIMWNAKASS